MSVEKIKKGLFKWIYNKSKNELYFLSYVKASQTEELFTIYLLIVILMMYNLNIYVRKNTIVYNEILILIDLTRT